MSKIEFNGFVCDEDSQDLADAFPSGYAVQLPVIGITPHRGTPDRAVVTHAREHGRIVVTRNTRHFVKEMRAAAQRCTPGQCFEGGGIITVPHTMRKLRFAAIEKNLTLRGIRIYWVDVFSCNLHVDVYQDGRTAVVRELPLCDYFKRDHIPFCERCQELGIGTT